MTIDESRLDSIIDEYNAEQGSLISILQDVQAEYKYLPKVALEYVAKQLDIPRVQVFGVATFFKAFSLKPKGRQQIHVCMGTACHVRGSKKVLEEFERKLGIEAGGTTKDGEYTLETVNCVGACALGPVVVNNEEYHGQMTPIKVESLLKKA
ncbi:MAG: NADH-quinone oxidoreductase subunit NuoE [Candidatus Methanoperedens sp.]|nr:NADH-quinone oxidoreductase subunit NuoE [Candidatus Methanoperedens sp.]